MRKEYKQMMDQLSPREELVEQVLAQAGAHAEQKQNRRRPMHKKKLILALAAALVVLTGSAFAAAYQAGVLDIFFRGDTSSLESYRTIQSTEDENYRLTVDMHASDKNGQKRVGDQRLFAGDAVAYFKDQVLSVGNNDMYPLQTIALDFTVTDADEPLTIGVTTSGAATETWYKIDNFRLYRVDNPVLELDEEEAYVPGTEGMTDIRLVRSLEADSWNTFCVPFSLDEAETEARFSAVKALSSVEKNGNSWTLDFTDAGRIEAGVPYLVKPLASATEMTLHDAAVTSTESTKTTIDGVNFIGTYSPTTIRSGEFFISDDMFYLADTDVSVKGYRAYITLDSNPANQVNRLRISIDGVPTAITAVQATDGNAPVDVYSLAGICLKHGVKASQALDGLPRGTYIVDGQKILKD